MISSRSVDELHPKVKAMTLSLLSQCKGAGIDLLITSTYRDNESQNALYAQGRTSGGAIVTNANGGYSFHNYRVAIDVVPLVNGKCDWSGTSQTWQQVVKIAKSIGFEWAGDWKTFKERAHFQYTNGLTINDFLSGKTIPN